MYMYMCEYIQFSLTGELVMTHSLGTCMVIKLAIQLVEVESSEFAFPHLAPES